MLSRLVIGPEFNNYQGGEGQTVSLLGALPVELHARPGLLAETTRRIELVPLAPTPEDDHGRPMPSDHATTVASSPLDAPARDLDRSGPGVAALDSAPADAASPAEPSTVTPT